jgi:hypothetical protein
MTGTFTIKRRKQANPRPDGQNSQLGILQALGIGVGRSSPHVGSKRGYDHLTDPASEIAFARAQEWHAQTGRPLPPQMRVRRPLAESAPMSLRDRAAEYIDWGKPLGKLTIEALLDEPRLTPSRRRRLLHKAGAHGERPAGFTPSRPAPGPRAPHSVAAQRRARKNAAQQARHLAKGPAHDPAA